MITSIRFIFIVLSLSFMYGCSESNGVNYMNPSPKHGFATNKEVFAAQYFASNKQWRAPQGTMFTLPVKVKNVSASAWSSETAEQAIRLSYHWLDLKKNMLIFEGQRTSLAGIVVPGGEQTVHLQVAAPAQPGRYILQVTLLQEGVAWFENQYVTPLELQIDID